MLADGNLLHLKEVEERKYMVFILLHILVL